MLLRMAASAMWMVVVYGSVIPAVGTQRPWVQVTCGSLSDTVDLL